MNAIFGILRRDGNPVMSMVYVDMMMAIPGGGDGGGDLLFGNAGLGCVKSGPGRLERLSFTGGGGKFAFGAAVRLDNRDELGRLLGLTAELPDLSDGQLLLRAYEKLGEGCVSRIYGDWVFAAYHPAEKRFFVARDYHGNSSLYFLDTPKVFAFSTLSQSLLALGEIPAELNEDYLAHILLAWPNPDGQATAYKGIRRLPPAHCMSVTPEWVEIRQYWRLEDTPLLRLRDRREYVEGFRAVFDEAVRDRLRQNGPFAATLSGGLDSGSISATAARMLFERGEKLRAFTSIPAVDPSPYVQGRFADELPFARATANFAGNIDLTPFKAEKTSVIQAIRRSVEIHNAPLHAAGNAYWLLEMFHLAKEAGAQTVLTGQLGNAGLSWAGDPFSQPLGYQIQRLGPRQWLRETLQRSLPEGLLSAWKRRRFKATDPRAFREFCRRSAVNPDFARRLNLMERVMSDPERLVARTPVDFRCRFLRPGNSFVGALWAETALFTGLEILDPSADARLLAYTFSVPDEVFIDPQTGTDRWLIRAAMEGRLPDEVRLNRRYGQQAGDLVPRLRVCAREVDAALDEIERGPAAAYVDAAHLRETWRMIQAEDTPEAYLKATIVLTRGIGAGVFVNGVGGSFQ